jgi:hypothetical protein
MQVLPRVPSSTNHHIDDPYPFLPLLTPLLPPSKQGNVVVVGRKSPYSLYDPVIASFEDDKGLYNQADAGGFIKLQALRLRTLGVNRNRN